jgi:branched-chain amino acid transport system permease protein
MMRPARISSLIPAFVGAALIVLMAVLPLLNISIPGVLPTPTYMPGTLALLSLCMVFAALALSYNLLLGSAGMLSFGHALYFGAGAYGLGIALDRFGVPLWPGIFIALIGGMVIAFATGAVAMRVSGIPFAMVTLAFAQAGSVLVRRNSEITGGEEGLSLNTEHVPDFLVGVINTRNLYWFALAVLVIVYLVVLWVDTSRTVPRAVSADLTITILVMVVLGGVGFRWGAIVGGVLYTLLDQRLTVVAGSDVVAGLPDVLRIPLSEPLFLLGVLFILVVMFLPGGIAGTIDAWWRRRKGEKVRLSLRSIDDADAEAEAPVEVRA